MLGGMWGLPSTTWHNKADPDQVSEHIKSDRNLNRHVRHVFTHFSLDLYLHTARLKGPIPDGWKYVSYDELRLMGLPSLYDKAVKMIEPQEL